MWVADLKSWSVMSALHLRVDAIGTNVIQLQRAIACVARYGMKRRTGIQGNGELTFDYAHCQFAVKAY